MENKEKHSRTLVRREKHAKHFYTVVYSQPNIQSSRCCKTLPEVQDMGRKNFQN
jgi:hypothetical protein